MKKPILIAVAIFAVIGILSYIALPYITHTIR
jgi:hypothetical protein